MTPGSLLNLVLKILGIFFIRDVLEALSQLVSVLVYFPLYSTRIEAVKSLTVASVSLFLYLLLSLLLIFRTERLVRLMGLDRRLPAQPGFTMLHRSEVLKIAIIFLGLWILVSAVPEAVRQVIYYLQEVRLYTRMAHPDLSYLFMAGVKIVFGLALVIWNRKIASMIEVKRKNKVSWYWPARVPFMGKRKRTG
jgi:hypothetical protein